MRKVVKNADVAARAGEARAVYADGSRVTRLETPTPQPSVDELMTRVERALRERPEPPAPAPAPAPARPAPRTFRMKHLLDAKGRIELSIVTELPFTAGSRQFTMHHVRNELGQIERTEVTETLPVEEGEP